MAYQGCDLAGIVPISSLQRLKPVLTQTEGEANVALTFTVDERSHPVVIGQITATVSMQCQRCLGDTNVTVDANVNVGIVAGETQAKALPKDLDPWTVVDSSADLYHLIEEEILLALPMVAYHDELCVDQTLFSSDEQGSGQAGVADNPFSVLEQLKGSPKQ